MNAKEAYTSLSTALERLGLRLVPAGTKAVQDGNTASITDFTVEYEPDSLGDSRTGFVTTTVEVRMPSKTDEKLLDLANELGTAIAVEGYQRVEVTGANLSYDTERLLTAQVQGVYVNPGG